MKKITLLAFMALAFMAGAIISVNSPAAAQGIYLDFGNNPGPRYRDHDGPRYRDDGGRGYRDGRAWLQRQRTVWRSRRGWLLPPQHSTIQDL